LLGCCDCPGEIAGVVAVDGPPAGDRGALSGHLQLSGFFHQPVQRFKVGPLEFSGSGQVVQRFSGHQQHETSLEFFRRGQRQRPAVIGDCLVVLVVIPGLISGAGEINPRLVANPGHFVMVGQFPIVRFQTVRIEALPGFGSPGMQQPAAGMQLHEVGRFSQQGVPEKKAFITFP
jgi:hypothetical protein